MPAKKKAKKQSAKKKIKESKVDAVKSPEKPLPKKKEPAKPKITDQPKEVIKKVLKRAPKKLTSIEKHGEEIEEELKEIYEDEGELPDMTKLERKPRRWWLMGVLGIV
ncbi:hypothetical protein GWN26_13840, partial [Candidatus Saccharibacteria bacterium]|nr:hypothetical protein [Candidatus Saccharibacteria bacterium]NIV04371.1 hypothetical protein [Calditrichia bacterium]NIS38917.1 hypothetical protein [Candidatus Saccharibacteria bacterium]NIV72904.1 hypothetical protein [Calditrichia bacterium]NIW00135.1 hypothetical protein [Candidatus Saccharibacteria bacterium]